MNVGTLFVKFGADLSEFARGSDEVGRRLDGIGKRVDAVGVSMTKWVTGPIVAATAGIVALAKSTGDYADRIGDLTDITGMSARSIQEWQYIAKIAGVETEAVTTAVEGLVRRLPQLEVEGGRSTEQLAKLGLTFADLQGMAPDKMMETLIRRLSAMEDPLERNAIGSALFGGAWKNIAPILGMGAGAIDEARKRASELGLVMSDESLDAADKFRRAMVELTSTLGGAARNIGAELAPVITDILLPAIRDRVVPAIAGFVAKIRELIRWFADLSPTWRNVIGLAVGCAVAIGPVLVVVGKLIPLFGVLAGVIKGVGAAKKALAAVLVTKFAPAAVGAGAAAGTAAVGVGMLKAALTAITGPVGIVVGFISLIVAVADKLPKSLKGAAEAAEASAERMAKARPRVAEFRMEIAKTGEQMEVLAASSGRAAESIGGVENAVTGLLHRGFEDRGVSRGLGKVVQTQADIVAENLKTVLGRIAEVTDRFRDRLALVDKQWQLWQATFTGGEDSLAFQVKETEHFTRRLAELRHQVGVLGAEWRRLGEMKGFDAEETRKLRLELLDLEIQAAEAHNRLKERESEAAGFQRQALFRTVEALAERYPEGFDLSAYLAEGVELGIQRGLSRAEAEQAIYGFHGLSVPTAHDGGEFRAPRPGGEGRALLKDREFVLPAGEVVRTPERMAAGGGPAGVRDIVQNNYFNVTDMATASTVAGKVTRGLEDLLGRGLREEIVPG
jgi:hypothetical protein